MPITVSWDNDDKTALLIDFQGRYTSEETIDAYMQAWSMIAEQPHLVHVINDVSKAPLPPTSHALTSYKRMADACPRNAGKIVVIGISGIGRLLSEAFTRALNRESRLILVNTVDEARRKLAELQVPQPE